MQSSMLQDALRDDQPLGRLGMLPRVVL
jgi:hypothetical protein